MKIINKLILICFIIIAVSFGIGCFTIVDTGESWRKPQSYKKMFSTKIRISIRVINSSSYHINLNKVGKDVLNTEVPPHGVTTSGVEQTIKEKTGSVIVLDVYGKPECKDEGWYTVYPIQILVTDIWDSRKVFDIFITDNTLVYGKPLPSNPSLLYSPKQYKISEYFKDYFRDEGDCD